MHFTDAETGLYMRLLCVQWSTGSIPNDDVEIASYGKGGTPIARVKLKFKEGPDGRLRNERLEIERQKQIAYRESRSANGKHGGRPCKPHANHMVSQTKAQESSPSPSPSPVIKKKKEVVLVEIPEVLNKEPFLGAWQEWAQHRVEIKKPMTAQATRLQLNSCVCMGISRSVAAIHHSIKCGYMGIYEPKGDKNGSYIKPPVDLEKVDYSRGI